MAYLLSSLERKMVVTPTEPSSPAWLLLSCARRRSYASQYFQPQVTAETMDVTRHILLTRAVLVVLYGSHGFEGRTVGAEAALVSRKPGCMNTVHVAEDAWLLSLTALLGPREEAQKKTPR